MAFKFGTSGVRGLVSEFQPELTHILVNAFLEHAKSKFKFTQVAIARDLRESSLGLAYFCKEAIESSGLKVLDLEEISTPNLALYCQSHSVPGIMVTGSHIPADRNGVKFYFSTGEVLKEDETAIWNLFEKSLASVQKSQTEKVKAEEEYLARYEHFFSPYKEHFKGQRIIVFQHSTPLRSLLVKLFSNLGFDVIAEGHSNIFVPVDTEAVGETKRISDWIQKYNQSDKKVVAVISTDGDGDRPFVCDEKGNQVRGDVLGLITSQFLKVKTIVTPVSSTTAIDKTNQFTVIRTKIGSPFVIDGILKAKDLPVAGFEANGGYILASEVTNPFGRKIFPLATRDSVLPILASVTAALWKKVTLSQLVESLPARITSSELLRDFKPGLVEKVTKTISEKSSNFVSEFGEIESIDQTDGMRVTLRSGDIVHFRPSGNAPEYRIYAESTALMTSEVLCQKGIQFLVRLN